MSEEQQRIVLALCRRLVAWTRGDPYGEKENLYMIVHEIEAVLKKIKEEE